MAQSNTKAAPKKASGTYYAVRPIKHNGEFFAKGDEVDNLTDENLKQFGSLISKTKPKERR